jgi:glycosyltransferase involved in cell wall biosynthesis
MDEKHPSCAEKAFAITNGISPEGGHYPKDRKANGCFTICHLGTLYNDRNPSDFLKGLRQWLDSKGVEFENKVSVTFVGRGSDEVERAAHKYGLENVVRAYGHKTREELPEILGNADVFLLCLGYREASRYVIPAKMYDYIGAEKPVIAFAPTDGEVFNLMRRLGLAANVVTSPDSARVTAILEQEYQRCTSNGNQYSVPHVLRQEYDYSTVSQRIERVISLAIEGHASRKGA